MARRNHDIELDNLNPQPSESEGRQSERTWNKSKLRDSILNALEEYRKKIYNDSPEYSRTNEILKSFENEQNNPLLLLNAVLIIPDALALKQCIAGHIKDDRGEIFKVLEDREAIEECSNVPAKEKVGVLSAFFAPPKTDDTPLVKRLTGLASRDIVLDFTDLHRLSGELHGKWDRHDVPAAFLPDLG